MADLRNNYFNETLKIISTGYSLENLGHPFVEFLSNPFFKKLQLFTDQAIMLLNQTNMKYLYVSDNVANICGYDASEFLSAGVDLAYKIFYPEDAERLVRYVYPDFDRCRETLNENELLNIRFSHDCRLVKKDGSQVRILQHTIPLAIENNKASLCLLVIHDISAYKKRNYIGYKMVLYDKDGFGKTLLEKSTKENENDFELTKREIEVLDLTANGFSEKEIASRLYISLQTVKSHRKNMLTKTNFKNSAELVRYAVANQII